MSLLNELEEFHCVFFAMFEVRCHFEFAQDFVVSFDTVIQFSVEACFLLGLELSAGLVFEVCYQILC